MTQHVVNVLLSGVFHASILFLVAAGLQVVFGVQKIFNLACGSFYALGAYAGGLRRRLVRRRRRTARALHPAAGARGPRRGRPRYRRRARPSELRLRPRRNVPAPPDVRGRPHDGGRDPHDLGHLAPLHFRALSDLRPGADPWRGGAGLQPDRHRGEPRHRAVDRLAPHADHVRAHHARHRRQSRDGRGARRRHAPRLRQGLHAGHRPRHARRRARHPRDCGDERDGHRVDRRSLRRRRDRRAWLDAGRVRRRARRRGAPLDRDLGVPRARDAPDLSDRDRGARGAAARPLRRSRGVKGGLVVVVATGAVAAAPLVASTYHVLLMLPFMAYAVVLLGLNLLFGYAGLVSFGHALFIGIGAYTGAFLTTHGRVRSLEVILVCAAVLGGLVAVPVAALCVRYVKIYFGMLTLAFGMVFYTFVLKFYRLTGGDEGTPFLRPSLLGRSLDAMPKIDYLVGPYYYYALAVLILATLGMWRIVHSPFGLCLKTIRDNPVKAETLGIGVTRYRFYAFIISAIYAAVGGALLGPPTGNVDPTLAYWTHSGNLVFMTLLGGFASFFGPVVGAFVFIYLQN